MEDDQNPHRNSLGLTISRLFRGRARALTEKELQEAINSSEEEGILNESEGDMLQSIFEFGDTIVREVMVPRTDMVCCPAHATLSDFLKLIIRFRALPCSSLRRLDGQDCRCCLCKRPAAQLGGK